MKLDPATLIFVSALTGLFLPLVLLGLRRTKETGDAVSIWTRATFLYASGRMCLLMRNAIPDAISITLGNVLLLLGYAEFYQGFRVFFGRTPVRAWQWPVALLYVTGLLLYVDGPQAFEIRVILASVFLGGASVAIAKELLSAGNRFRVQSKEVLGSEHLVFFAFGVAFCANAIFLMARAIVFTYYIATRGGVSSNDLFYAASYLIAIFVHLLLAAGLPLLLSRRTQRELVSSEASLLKVQQVGRVAYAWLDSQTKIITGNDVFREALGIPSDLEISLEMWLSMVHRDDLPRMRSAATLTQGGVYFAENQEYRIFRYADHKEIWVEISSQVLSDPMDGHPMLLSILRDITGIKQAELAAIRAKQAAEQASQSKSQFLANMSHEIRTPINAVLGMLALLQNTALNSRQEDYVGKAEGATRGLLGLINDILDFSKVGAGKMILEKQPFSVDTLLRNLAVLLSTNTRSKNIDVLFDIDPLLPDLLEGDALRLQQILINLASNAIKFTQTGQVVVGMQALSTSAGGARVAFSVQDSGIGIAPEHQVLIFDAFSQAEASTTRRFGGTGLGLAITKHLVELMGGTLEVESTYGEGSTFRFEIVFPVPSAGVSDPQSSVREHSLKPGRILIVDDNPLAGQIFVRQLQSQGWQPVWVGSGEEALALVHEEVSTRATVFPFPFVLVDWQMPGLDGWEVTRELRTMSQRCGGAAPSIIMVSSNGRHELGLRSDAEQALIDGFLVKPLTCSMIRDAFLEATLEHPGLRKLPYGRSTKRQLAGMRILVVEDNLLNQQVAEELLSNEGALVSLAANGRLGVEAVETASPQFDVVLMDIQMPVMDGYEATSVIRTRLGQTHLPIIAMTANAMTGDREACLAAGMDEHIGKPFDMARLISQLIRSTGFQTLQDDATDSASMPDAAPITFPDIAGMDLNGALARMSHANSLYQRTALEFLKKLATLRADVQAELQATNMRAAVMTLHTVKGIAGTLGLTLLAQEAGRLERTLANDMDLQTSLKELDALESYVKQASDQLHAAIALLVRQDAVRSREKTPDEPVQASDTRLVSLVSGLADLLKQSDMQALEIFASDRSQFELLPEGLFDRLDTALQDLDFLAAHHICVASLAVLRP